MPTHKGKQYDSNDYRDGDVLEELYIKQRLSTVDISEIFGVAYSTVGRHLKLNGIETRDKIEASKEARCVNYANYRLHSKDKPHPVWEDRARNGGSKVRVHQLLAIACGEDPYEVFSPGTDVHHKNGMMWDNRPGNIELLSHEEHSSLHSSGESNPSSELTETQVREIKQLLSEGELTQKEIGERFGVTQSTVSTINLGKRWGHVEAGAE